MSNRIGRWKHQEWRDQLGEVIAPFQVRGNTSLKQEGRGNAEKTQAGRISKRIQVCD